MLGSLTGLVAFVASLGVMFFLVPTKYIGRYLWIGLIGGMGLAVLLNIVMQNVLGYWQFHDVDILYLSRVPMFLAGVWAPLVVVFAYLVRTSRSLYLTGLIIGAFAAAASFAHWFMIIQGTLVYQNWTLLGTFILAAILHSGLFYYVHLATEAEKAAFR